MIDVLTEIYGRLVMFGKPSQCGFKVYDRRGKVIKELPERQFAGLDQMINTGYEKESNECTKPTANS